MNTNDKLSEREEIESLLPWHAAGTLSRRDAERVEAALARDSELARQYAVVREELAETITLNESLGAPSARAMEQLFAKIDAEEAVAPRPVRRSLGIGAWVAERLSSLAPRTLAYSAIGAALALALQAGLLATWLVKETTGTYQTASYGDLADAGKGAYALIRFAPEANAAQISQFLEANKVAIVDGPKAGGLYRIRLAATKLPADELARVVTRLGQDTSVVGFVAPSE